MLFKSCVCILLLCQNTIQKLFLYVAAMSKYYKVVCILLEQCHLHHHHHEAAPLWKLALMPPPPRISTGLLTGCHSPCLMHPMPKMLSLFYVSISALVGPCPALQKPCSCINIHPKLLGHLICQSITTFGSYNKIILKNCVCIFLL